MKTPLKKLAEIRAGYHFRGRVEAAEAGANVRLIQIKDIDEGLRLQTGDLAPIRLERPQPYLVSAGDVLFLSRGHRRYAVLIESPLENTIATGYFFILRADPARIDPAFLAWSLNQAGFQEELRALARGTHMPMISKGDLQELKIQVPTLAVQDRILALQRLFERERELTLGLLDKRGRLVEAVSRWLLADGSNTTPKELRCGE